MPNKRLYLSLLLLSAIFMSCQREVDVDNFAPRITARTETQSSTRTSLSVDEAGQGTIYWNPADRINVFFGTTRVLYTSQNKADATSAVFQTTDNVTSTTVSSTNIWGLYPSDDSSTCDGNSVTTTLPSQQYGIPETFDDDLFITLAYSNSTTLQFYNVCGGIKFSLSRDDIKAISFRGNNNENLAGKVKLSFSNDLPNATVVNGVKEITLTPKSGQTFSKDVNYYIVTLPSTLSNGFTMTFTTTDGAVGTLNYTDKAVTLKRSIFSRQKQIDSFATFEGGSQSNNVIYYTTDNGKIVTPYKTDVFGAGIVSNEYVNGQGILTFDGSVTTIGDYAFFYCGHLTSIVIPDSVTSFGISAFDSCNQLTAFDIPGSVESIDDYAFYNCVNLTSIEIPSSVTQIGDRVFSCCTALASITVDAGNPVYDSRNGCNAIIETKSKTLVSGCKNTVIPSSVTGIGKSAFYHLTSLTSIDIPNSVTTIGDHAFFRCTGLNSLVIPYSVTSIEFDAFTGCSGLTSIKVDSSNPNYDSRDNCNALIETKSNTLIVGCKNTGISNTVTSIKDSAFADCVGLTSIEIPKSVTSIGDIAFDSCTGLTSVTVYATTPPSIGNSVFSNTNDCPIYVPAESLEVYKTAQGWSKYADRIFPISQPNNVIYYTSSDGKIVTPYKTDVFGANIVSNVYVDGQGIITFDGDVTSIGYMAFSYCSSLTSTKIPALVSSIGEYAFLNCGELLSIEIPNSVTSIGDSAFLDCSTLASIEIPNSVTSIGIGAFRACSALTAIEIPNSVTSIGFGAFSFCGLVSISVNSDNPTYDSRNNCNAIIETISNTLISGCSKTIIPNSVKSIGSHAFMGCSELISIDIPNSVTSIGYAAFSSSGLTSIDIPISVKSIGHYAFLDCKLSSIIVEDGNSVYDSRDNCNAIIETINNCLIVGCMNTCIPNSLTSIKDEAFRGCDGLTIIMIPDSITSIGNHAFNGCSDLTSIVIANSVTSIGHAAFLNCANLISVVVYATTPPLIDTEVFYHTNSCPIYVPVESLDAYISAAGWSEYADRIFPLNIKGDNNIIYYTSSDEKIITPNKTDVFGANIVSNEYVDGQGIITFDGDVTSIGDHAFIDCSTLTAIKIPDSVTSIGGWAFEDCSELSSIEIPERVTNIGYCAFYGCSGLKSIELPNCLESIAESAFVNCSSLTSFVFPDSLTSIGNDAFYNCRGLTSIEIPPSLTTINGTPFRYCSGLESIRVQTGNPKYDSRNNCNAIIETQTNTLILGCKNTAIPNSIEIIGQFAFIGSALTSVIIPSSVTTIGFYAYADCRNLASIIIPSSVTIIKAGAFHLCTNLKSITLASSITSIEEYAFQYCYALTSIELPSSVTSIGKGAFERCSALASFTIFATIPPVVGESLFIDTNDFPIFVPAESVDIYKSAENWSDYADRIQAIPK